LSGRARPHLCRRERHGRTLRMGELAVQCEIPTARCRMTMQAQADLPNDPTVLRTIVREAGPQLGIDASVSVRGVWWWVMW
jgi:hypothetical protein